MQEVERQSLMGAMGLRAFQPRFVLAGAKPSLALPVILEEPSSAPLHIQSVNAEVATNTTALISPSALFKDESAPRAATNTTAKDQDNTSKQEAIRCRYRLVRLGELLVFFEQKTTEWEDVTLAKSFFADMYFALAQKKYEYWLDVQFDWPPVKNFPRANDSLFVSQSVQTFVNQHIAQPPCKWMVIFGEASAQYVLEKSLAVGETGFMQDMPVLMLEPYWHYWQSPHKKILLWQHLQVIKKSLVTNAN